MNFMQVLRKNGFLSKNLIYNKTVLYLILIIALTNLFIIFQQNDIFSIVFFFLIGFLTTFFSKNMIVILCMCLFFTNVLKYGRSAAGHSRLEGFEPSDDVTPSKKDKDTKDKDTKDKDTKDKDTNSDKKPKDMNPDTSKDESFEPANDNKKLDTKNNNIKNEEVDPAVAQQDKLLDNMNKYKSLLDTLQGITQNMKDIKGVSK